MALLRDPATLPPPPLDDVIAPRSAPSWASPVRRLFASPLVKIGTFRAGPRHPQFRDSGPISEPLFVFPRTAVAIQHAGGRPFVGSPNVITCYNAGQVYWRTAIDPAGDFCEWFAPEPGFLLEVLRTFDPAVVDRPETPFPFGFVPGDARCYVEQRLLVRRLAQRGPVDVLRVEETVARLLLRLACRAFERPRRLVVQPAHRELAERLKEVLGLSFHEDRSLADLAAAVGCSPFYLSRVFRAVDGRSIHQYRLQLRLSRSLERVAVGRDLRAVAQEVGFSSHSHFTAAFRRAFGITPSEFRRGVPLFCRLDEARAPRSSSRVSAG